MFHQCYPIANQPYAYGVISAEQLAPVGLFHGTVYLECVMKVSKNPLLRYLRRY